MNQLKMNKNQIIQLSQLKINKILSNLIKSITNKGKFNWIN